MRTYRSAAALLVVLVVSGSAAPAPVSGGPERTERLAALGRVWTAVRYGHPYLAYRDIDWDAALVAAIPKALAATDARTFGTAVQGMLDALGDPASRVIERTPPPGASPPPAGIDGEQPIESLPDGVVVVRLTNARNPADMSRVVAEAQKDLTKVREATAVVVDLRSRVAGGGAAIAMRMAFDAIGPAIVTRPVEAPPIRTWVHSGYRPQSGRSSGGYSSALQTTAGDAFAPLEGVKPKRVAFIVSVRTEIPGAALALQRSADAIIVAEGGVSEVAGVPTIAVPLSEGQMVRIRTGEVVYPNRTGVRADVVVPAAAGTAGDAPMKAALAFVRGGARPAPASSPADAASHGHAEPTWRADRTYEEMHYPTLEYRLLALYRLWGILDAFFPYKHLLSRDWDSTLAEFIPKIEAARDAREYALTIAELAARTEDTHVGVTGSAELTRLFGEAPSPAVVRYIEGVPVVTAFLDADAARAAGLEIGDVILKVDGEDIETRAAHVVGTSRRRTRRRTATRSRGGC